MPVEHSYSQSKDVREDIGLTDEKAAELAKVHTKWNTTFRGGDLGGGGFPGGGGGFPPPNDP